MFPVDGPEFLVVYSSLLLAGALARWLILHHLRQRAALLAPPDARTGLSAAEVGHLIAGPPRAHAARLLAAQERSTSEHEPHHRADPAGRLEELGLILDGRQRGALRLWGGAIFGGLLAAGVARLWVGVLRDRPVGLLLVLLVIAVSLLVWAVRDRVVRTTEGDRIARDLASRFRSGLGDTGFAMGFALFGWSALADDPGLQAYLHSHGILASPSSGGCTTSSWICWAGCSGGGGGGGGGGDGGGGCGGCGGGD